MTHALAHLNYLAVLVTAVAGFMLGWLWYSPAVFGRAWMQEMNITMDSVKNFPKEKMFAMLAVGFLYTLLSTFALATIERVHGNMSVANGALFGLFVGAFIVGTRKLNTALWSRSSCRLQAIVVGQEIVLFTLQGAILGVWR